jgi:F-type H+-transporting ATPase subunit gamma
MASLRELRRKIKSVKSTQQITKAMKMVAAARLRRAQTRILSARPFALKMRELMADLVHQAVDVNKDNELTAEELAAFQHPLMLRKDSGPRGLLLITADKGLCGAFNTNLIKKALEFLKEHREEKVVMFCVGRKGRDFFKRIKGVEFRGEYINVFNKLSFIHAEVVGDDILKFFLKDGGRDVTVIYNEFKSVIQQKLTRETVLPLSMEAQRSEKSMATDFIYEPKRDELLEGLLPRYVKAQIFRAMLESAAAELGARMSAMENASRNAKELIEVLTLTSNKIRQAAITKEISEIVGGAESLN